MFEYQFTRRRISERTLKGNNPADILSATRSIFEGAENERFVVIAMDNQNRILGVETLYMGNAYSALLRVGEVFRLPVRLNATRMVIAHNHPSGEVIPSTSDIHSTTEIVRAGTIMDIPLLDHIIVGEGGRFLGMRQHGTVQFGDSV
jgi:DNA repair protein RadC